MLQSAGLDLTITFLQTFNSTQTMYILSLTANLGIHYKRQRCNEPYHLAEFVDRIGERMFWHGRLCLSSYEQ